MYGSALEAKQNGEQPRFKGLLEIISSEVVILTAVHSIKANRGSETPGSDGETMRINILEQDYQEVISRVKEAMKDYRPAPVRRVYIPKPGKTEKRPLGIITAIDKVVQECVRIIIEPILEAQFFAHSYGFRPMRDAHMAMERVADTAFKTGHHWVRYGGEWVAACKVSNLTSVHSQYKSKIPALTYRGHTIGITSLAFCKWTKTRLKNQNETSYTKAGRDMYQKRTSRSRLQARADGLLIVEPLAGKDKEFILSFPEEQFQPLTYTTAKGTQPFCQGTVIQVLVLEVLALGQKVKGKGDRQRHRIKQEHPPDIRRPVGKKIENEHGQCG
jgi:hypothetical protein